MGCDRVGCDRVGCDRVGCAEWDVTEWDVQSGMCRVGCDRVGCDRVIYVENVWNCIVLTVVCKAIMHWYYRGIPNWFFSFALLQDSDVSTLV